MSRSLSHGVVAALALMVGVVVGGLGPRGEARELRGRVSDLQSRECRGSSGLGSGIVGALQGRPMAFDGSGDSAPPAPDPEPEPVQPATEEIRSSPPGPIVPIEGPTEATSEMDAIVGTMDLRRAQSQQALFDYGGLDADQQEASAAVIDDLNAELGLLADTLVGQVAEYGEPDRRESMLFARDALDVLLDAEEGLLDIMSEEQRIDLDPKYTDPFNYIDGSVVWVLSELDRP